MSDTDPPTYKKVGLAKLAKARSISNGINNLGLDLEDTTVNVLIVPKSSTIPSVLLTSPTPVPSPSKGDSSKDIPPLKVVPATPVSTDEVIKLSISRNETSTALPNKVTIINKTTTAMPHNINVINETSTAMPNKITINAVTPPPLSALTKNNIRIGTANNSTIPSSPETEKKSVDYPSERIIAIVQSDGSNENLSKTKEDVKDDTKGSSKKSFLQNLNRKSFRKKKVDKEEEDFINHQLKVPKAPVSRSRSLSRLSDVFSQVHNVCLTPTKAFTDSEGTHRTGKRGSWTIADQSHQTSFEDDSSEEFDTISQGSDVSDGMSRRWSSLGQLYGEAVAPLSQMKPMQAKQMNYLFGGLGSLLGATELERYFPDRNVVIFIATWNMNGKEPPNSLDDFLLPDDVDRMPDMYVIGTQESCGDRTEWEVRLQTTIGPSHVLFHSAVLGILHLTVFLRRDLVWFCSVPEDACHSLRPGTYFKTKGAIAISFQFFGTKMLLVNTHLFAHEEKLSQRIQNYKNIVQNLDVPRNLKGMKMKRSKDVTNRYDVVFWLGDLNFRLEGPRDQILEKIREASVTGNDLDDLMWFDQLTKCRKKGEIFQDFFEGEIDFAPTFKFDVGTNHYDTSSKQRVPSYTDRILYKSTRDPIKCTNYGSCPLFKTSDHKPVWGLFHFKVRPGKDDVPLAAGLFQRDVYLSALKRRRRFFHQPSSRNCHMQ